MLWLVLIAALMWVLQCALGIWQFKKFNRHLRELRQEGRVAIGKARGRIVAGAIVMLCIDEQCRVIRGKKLQGMTIFANAKEFDHFNGVHLLDINAALCEGLDKQTRKAVLDAVEDYRRYTRRQEEEAAGCVGNPA